MKNSKRKSSSHRRPSTVQHEELPPAVEAFVKLLKSIRPHLTKILISIMVILVVVVIMVSVQRSRDQRLAAGFAELADAEATEKLIELSNEFDGTEVGELATLKLARSFYQNGNYEKALTYFSLFLKKYSNSEMAEAAELGEAYTLEASGKLAQAEASYDNISKTAVAQNVRMDALSGAGRTALNQGKLAQAEEYYQRLLEGSAEAGNFYKEKASNALADIRAKRQESKGNAPEQVNTDSAAESAGSEEKSSPPDEEQVPDSAGKNVTPQQ